jgi:hypothetical protein
VHSDCAQLQSSARSTQGFVDEQTQKGSPCPTPRQTFTGTCPALQPRHSSGFPLSGAEPEVPPLALPAEPPMVVPAVPPLLDPAVPPELEPPALDPPVPDPPVPDPPVPVPELPALPDEPPLPSAPPEPADEFPEAPPADFLSSESQLEFEAATTARTRQNPVARLRDCNTASSSRSLALVVAVRKASI